MRSANRFLLGLVFFMLILTGRVMAEDPLSQLTADERARFDELTQTRKKLSQMLNAIQLAFTNRPADISTQISANEKDILEYSHLFALYKIQRIVFGTNLTIRLLKDIEEYTSSQQEALREVMELEKTFAKVVADYHSDRSVVELNLEDLDGQKEKIARYFDGLNPTHRKIIDRTLKIVKTVEGDASKSMTNKSFTLLRNWLEPLREVVSKMVYNQITTLTEKKQSIVNLLGSFLSLKYMVWGYSFPENLRSLRNLDLKPNEVNIIVAPHGGPDEVAITSARIFKHLPKGSATILLAAYHFVEPTPDGLRLANAIRDNPEFIAVLAETSPHKDSAKTDPYDVQIRKAMERGVKNIIIFAEGRNTSRGGGFTPANQNTIRMLRLLGRQKIKVAGSDQEQRIAPRLTVLSGTLTNAQFDFAPGKHPIRLDHEFTLSAEETADLARKPAHFAAYLDALWGVRTHSSTIDRLGGTANEGEILKAIMSPVFRLKQLCLGI